MTNRQVMLGYLEMPLSQKPKDVLHNVDVPIKSFTFLSNDIEEIFFSKVFKQACIFDESISQNLQNLITCTKYWHTTELGITIH